MTLCREIEGKSGIRLGFDALPQLEDACIALESRSSKARADLPDTA